MGSIFHANSVDSPSHMTVQAGEFSSGRQVAETADILAAVPVFRQTSSAQ